MRLLAYRISVEIGLDGALLIVDGPADAQEVEYRPALEKIGADELPPVDAVVEAQAHADAESIPALLEV